MYNAQILVGIICDNCNNEYMNSNGLSYWHDKETVKEYAENDGWYCSENKQYCPDCHQFDDDDDLILTIQTKLK